MLAKLLVNPILLINAGGEMVYILSQRLIAQKVDPVKTVQVLNDILRSLFSQQLFTELMKPQKIMQMSFFKTLITKMVHCSIMKLNEASMQKLIDLILMDFKAQIVNTMHPAELYDVTQNHFNGIINIMKNGPAVEYLIYVQKKFEEIYSPMLPFDFLQIKIELLAFLQDVKQKVYVFIEDKTQNQHGDIRIVNSQTAGPHVQIPGLITKYDQEGRVLSKNQKFLESTDQYISNSSKSFINNETEWGQNMFLPGRQKRVVKLSQHSVITTESSQIRKGFKNDSQLLSELKLDSQTATQNLQNLASMIKGGSTSQVEDTFTYNIFSKPTVEFSSTKQAIDEDFFSEIITIDTSGSKQNMEKQIADMFGDLDIKENTKSKAEKEEIGGDDLLDMMDQLDD
ncbi:hypothetical protein ABPG73_020790 [Tetrahymena malaccensis]